VGRSAVTARWNCNRRTRLPRTTRRSWLSVEQAIRDLARLAPHHALLATTDFAMRQRHSNYVARVPPSRHREGRLYQPLLSKGQRNALCAV
jgi:hypothetical protein